MSAPTPGEVSLQAAQAALNQPTSNAVSGEIGFDAAAGQFITQVASNAQEIQGVQHTVTQIPGFPPAVFHTAGISYEIPVRFL